MLRIAVCGESGIALSVAAVLGGRGHHVRLLASAPGKWSDRIGVRLTGGASFVAALGLVTRDPRTALAGADLVFVCVPHSGLASMLRRIAPHVDRETVVGGVPGFGGFGPMARRLLPRVACLFGTQRIPFVVRHCHARRAVTIGAVRRQTFVGTIPARRAYAVAGLLQQVLGVRTVPVSHFLNVELSPSNSIVNPARLFALFGPGARTPGPEQEFFLHWNARASRMLLRLDEELQNGRRFIPRDTSFVAPILLQYDANDASTLTARFRGLHALTSRAVPLRRAGRRHVLDERSDYVREDIDHGLVVVRDILRLAGAPTPFMDEIIAWRVGLRRKMPRLRRSTALDGFMSIEELASALD